MERGPVFAQIYVQISYAIMYLLSHVVLQQGMSHYLFVFYRQCVACIAITLIVLFAESGRRTKPSLRDLGKIFVLALLGITISQNFYFVGLSLTSTTLGTAMYCMYPAITFILTLVFGMEKVRLGKLRGRAKLFGTFLCVGGAVFMTLVRGPVLFGSHGLHQDRLSWSIDQTWVLGALLIAGGVIAWSSTFIYKAWITLDCTSQLTTTAVMCWMGVLQSGFLAFLFVRAPDAWTLGWNLQLLTISYSGIFGSAIGLFVMLWCVKKKGPLFTSIFSPMCNVIVAILEPTLLHVPLRSGSLAGMFLVIGGLYIVLWGKSGEDSLGDKGEVVFSDPTEPLLNGDNSAKV